jgi:hypothetical protein
MTAYRQPNHSHPTYEGSNHDQRGDDPSLHLRPACGPSHADGNASEDGAAAESAHYLALALASRQAAGLPDEIAEHEPWRAFGRAISREDPMLATRRTSGVDRRSGFPAAQHPCVAAAATATGSEAVPTTFRQGRPPTSQLLGTQAQA